MRYFNNGIFLVFLAAWAASCDAPAGAPDSSRPPEVVQLEAADCPDTPSPPPAPCPELKPCDPCPPCAVCPVCPELPRTAPLAVEQDLPQEMIDRPEFQTGYVQGYLSGYRDGQAEKP